MVVGVQLQDFLMLFGSENDYCDLTKEEGDRFEERCGRACRVTHGWIVDDFIYHTIMPVAIETLGAIGPRSLEFPKDLDAREDETAVWGREGCQKGVSQGHSGCSSIWHFCV